MLNCFTREVKGFGSPALGHPCPYLESVVSPAVYRFIPRIVKAASSRRTPKALKSKS
jgi:hypothetical protein